VREKDDRIEREINCFCEDCQYYATLVELQVEEKHTKRDVLHNHNWEVITKAMVDCHSHADSPYSLTQYLSSVSDLSMGRRKREIEQIARCLSTVELMLGEIESNAVIDELSLTLAGKRYRGSA
jgi:hypothetical protein